MSQQSRNWPQGGHAVCQQPCKQAGPGVGPETHVVGGGRGG